LPPNEGDSVSAVLFSHPLPPKVACKNSFRGMSRKEFFYIMKKKITTKQLATDAMLAAMCAVLGYLAIDTGSVKVTFESLPILLGALLFGPLDGLLIGGVGTGIYQLLRYGISATTVLWMIPYMLCGLLVGLYAKKMNFSLNKGQTVFIVVVCELLITVLNTGVLFVDSKIYAYYFPGLISGALGLRLVLCVVKAVVFALVLPTLVRGVEKVVRR